VPVALSTGTIPEGIGCLLIVKPREKFNDYDLYQIDQFLMQGKSLAFFLECLDEVQMPGQAAYSPIETGLEPLLEHYGIQIQRAFVLDENCYRQELPAQLGAGTVRFTMRRSSEPVHQPGPRFHAKHPGVGGGESLPAGSCWPSA